MTAEEEQEVEDLRQEMLKAQEREAFLLSNGWKQNDGRWTAPVALQERRHAELGKAPNRYRNIELRHAYNTQRHEDRRLEEARDAERLRSLPA